VPEAKNAFHAYIAEAGATRDEVRDLDGERVRFVDTLQEPDFAGDNRGRGPPLSHFADHLHHVARPGVKVEEGKSHTGGAGIVFQEHQIGGGIREGDPAFQVHRQAVAGDLKGQRRDLRNAIERRPDVAADAGAGGEHGNRDKTGVEALCSFRHEPIGHSCHLSTALAGDFRLRG